MLSLVVDLKLSKRTSFHKVLEVKQGDLPCLKAFPCECQNGYNYRSTEHQLLLLLGDAPASD